MRLILCFVLFLICENTRGSIDPVKNLDVPNGNNVFIITLDGFRWQEVFSGADKALINDADYTADTAAAKAAFWADDVQERRKKLMPFFWSTIATQGTLLGNRDYGNDVNVSNIYRLSYQGYNEILTGCIDL